MSDAIKHECGISLLQLKKPLSLVSPQILGTEMLYNFYEEFFRK